LKVNLLEQKIHFERGTWNVVLSCKSLVHSHSSKSHCQM